MILTAHQPVYLPWLGLFHKIALCDAFCYFDDVQYLKKDWNNRNMIKTPNGVIWLTVPVLTKGHRGKPICRIEINNSVNWRKKHWQSIQLAYKKAPFFKRYIDFFEDIYAREWTYLSELNETMLKYLLKELAIDIRYFKASEIGFEGSKSELVLDMCVKLNAKTYVFGALGKEYADIPSFKRHGIDVYFQDYSHPV
ncbi:MAG: WbqC family protein, partial [Candidatus Omnitrophota bacterium]